MRRREFVTALGAVAVTWLFPGLSGAQGTTHIIGILAGTTETDQQAQRRVLAFTQALKELGWIEGKNIKLEKHTERGV
jgi:hypothetical protein